MSKKLSVRLWFGFALCFALVAVALLFASGDSALLLFPKGTPEDCADEFFALLEKGEYTAASALCTPALPAESRPEEADAAGVYDALCASRSWQRHGEAVRRGNRATVSGTLTVLDSAALTEGLNGEVNAVLSTLVSRARTGSEVYKEDGSYRDEVVMDAWNAALAARLERAGDYTRDLPLTLRLRYRDGQWRIEADEELLFALSGGIA